jgi:hypothetical protein
MIKPRYDAHTAMSTQALNLEVVQRGINDVPLQRRWAPGLRATSPPAHGP